MSKIIFLGTSVTKGTDYGGVTASTTFAHKIGVANGYAAADILNKGVGSDTAAGMLGRLSADVIAHAPDVCVVECGPNDYGNGILQASFASDLDSIFAGLVAAGIKPVALNSSMKRGGAAVFTGYQPYLKTFEERAALAGVPVVDLYRELATSYLYLTNAQFTSLYVDAIHLTIAGHQFVADLAARQKYHGLFVA